MKPEIEKFRVYKNIFDEGRDVHVWHPRVGKEYYLGFLKEDKETIGFDTAFYTGVNDVGNFIFFRQKFVGTKHSPRWILERFEGLDSKSVMWDNGEIPIESCLPHVRVNKTSIYHEDAVDEHIFTLLKKYEARNREYDVGL